LASRGAAVAYPLIIGSLVLPAVMALSGYYLTGTIFIDLVLRSLRYLLIVAVAGGLLYRWYRVNRMILEAGSDGTISGTGVDGKKGQGKVEKRNIQLSDMRVKKLFNFTIVLAIGIGLFTIWSEMLPALHFMKRVEILPNIRVRSQDAIAPPIALPMQLTTAPESERSPQGETSVSAEGPSKTVTPSAESRFAGDTSSDLSGAAEKGRVITLWDLIRALLSIIVIVIFTKNIPDVLDVVLIKRSHIDSGGRFAFSTLLRYGIIFVGLLTVANILGLKWSQVQWMAAGLTFGIGFGLQETIANFISGLILLVERPIRVGDAVSIGNLGGRVTRIRIRSTTITLWDQSEMVVPNKEFIMTKLINWTLSDSKRRIGIPVPVKYSSNIKQAKETLTSVAQKHPSVLENPPPHVVLLEFGKNAIQLELRFFVDFGQGYNTREDLNMSIEEAFHEAGIEFAVQSLDLQILKDRMGEDPEESG
jgi:potassium efflux system protein